MIRARRLLHRYVPATFHDPVGLAARLVRSGDAAAWFAMGSAAMGLATAPLDALLAPWERRAYRSAPEKTGPLVFVCGAPRAGTTLVCQTLVRSLPVSCFTNLTALFPSAPLTATRLFGRFLREPVTQYRSFYGRTTGLSGLNDGLHLWDRWLGSDRDDPAPQLMPAARSEMRRFFAAWTRVARRPLIAKCNRLNVAADLVGSLLPEASFICVERDPLPHAQSLLRAREMIHGATTTAYGLAGQDAATDDPLVSVARQVRFHQQIAQRQEQSLSAGRYWRVSYEDFCRDPRALVSRVAERLFGGEFAREGVGEIPAHRCANGLRLEPAAARRLSALLEGDEMREEPPAEKPPAAPAAAQHDFAMLSAR